MFTHAITGQCSSKSMCLTDSNIETYNRCLSSKSSDSGLMPEFIASHPAMQPDW